MIRMLAMTVALTLVQLPGAAVACESHLMINPDNLGFFGRAVVKMSGLAPPELEELDDFCILKGCCIRGLWIKGL